MSYSAFHEFERAGWEEDEVVAYYERELAAVTRQSTSALLGAGRVAAGSRVLDVACGPGFSCAAAADRGALVVGVDFSSAQVAAARSHYPHVRFEVADASALPFADASFDAVVCGFGMLHFPDALAAAVEARRVLVPGGRFAFTVWDQPERAVALGAVQAAIRAHGEAILGVPPGPDFFGLSDPRRSEQLLLDGGFHEPVVERVAQVWSLASAEHVVDTFQRATVRMRALLQAQSAAQLGRIRAAVRESLAPYRRGDGHELPMPALLTVGTKPA